MTDVLIIAPAADNLDTQPDEIAGLVRDLPGAIPLYGEVRERDILEAIRHARQIDGLIISGHGAAGALALCDGLLTPAAIASYANRAKAHWVMLNICTGDEAVQTILALSAADVIAARGDLDDRDAWRATRMIAQELSAGSDIATAFYAIRPNGYTYHRNRAARQEEQPPMAAESKLEVQIERLHNEIAKLRDDFNALVNRLNLAEFQIGQYHHRSHEQRPESVYVVLGAIIIAAIVLITLIVTM
jgi:hypothetical protein